MYLLGVHLPDHKLVRIALTNFYGISYDVANRLCARMSLHDRATVSSLTESQITQLSAYLSSPGSIPARRPHPTTSVPATLLSPSSSSSAASSSSSSSNSSTDSTNQASSSASSSTSTKELPPSMQPNPSNDPLRQIKIEADLKRVLHANINHHRNVGSYRGRRHAAHLPVRGQRTSTNANTAKKLNRLERRGFATFANSAGEAKSGNKKDGLSLKELLEPLVRIRFSPSSSA